MDINIERITIENYSMFDDMVFWRMNGRERTGEERLQAGGKCPDNIKASLEHKGFYVYAALHEGRYIGWISLIYFPKIGRWEGGLIYVDELWTTPVYRKKGVASGLMEKAFELQKKLGACKVRLYVDAHNPAAQSVYRRTGLKVMGETLYMES